MAEVEPAELAVEQEKGGACVGANQARREGRTVTTDTAGRGEGQTPCEEALLGH